VLALPAHAQMGGPGSEFQAPQRQDTDAWISIEPRTWLSFVQVNDDDDLVKEPIFVPMGGASITVFPSFAPGASVLLTGLYGKGDGDAFLQNFGGVTVDAEIERIDIEGLIRYQLPDTTISVFSGIRYITFDETYEYSDPVFGQGERTADSEVVVLEFGVGGFADLDPKGRHRLFGNLTGGVSFRETKVDGDLFGEFNTDETEPSLDINVGYQFVFNDMISFNMRYRSFYLFLEENDVGQPDMVYIHGPELGLSARF